MIDQVNKEITEALRNGDKKRADALKMLKNSLLNAQKNKGIQLSQEEAIQIIRKEIKMRVEARDLYAKNERLELAAKEEYERSLFDQYMPAGLTENQIDEIIFKAARQLKDSKSFSILMSEVMRQVAGRSDGKQVAELVKKYIEGE